MTQKRTAWSGIVLAALLLVVHAIPVFADSKPFFISQNGSIFAGGGFEPNCVAGTPPYQAPNYTNDTDRYNGGILAFANVGGSRDGAHSNLDAMALGLIEGGGSDRGFYSGRSGQSDLSLANVDSAAYPQGAAYWGGMLDGSDTRRNHCIPDYYSTKRVGTQQNRNNINLSENDGQYQITQALTTFNGGTVNNDADGKKLTYFIDGDLYIRGDIDYPSYTEAQVPKLAIVVKGNIFVDPGVRNLDGWYIAQPDGGNEGAFWTCHDGNPSNAQPVDTWVRSNCDNPLMVNGAVTARQVNLLRVNSQAGRTIPSTPAETFTYTPAMVIGGPFFNQPPSVGDGIQSLISLPPVF